MNTIKWTYYKDFSNSLKTAEYLYSLDTRLNNDPPRDINQLLSSQTLRGSVCVLSVAVFEAFLRKIFEGYASELNSPNIIFLSLPDKIKLTSIYNTMEYYLKPPKSAGLASDRIARIPAILSLMNTIGSGNIDPLVFANTSSNPSPEQVKKMLSDMGITDFYRTIKNYFEAKWGASVADNFISDKLDEIVNRRHSVAHTGSASGVTRVQLKETFKFLRALAKCIEHALFEHIKHLLATCI